jgi:hypothetical protein
MGTGAAGRRARWQHILDHMSHYPRQQRDEKAVFRYNEEGRDCTVLDPWPGKAVALRRDGEQAAELAGERVTFRTRPGERIRLVPRERTR